MASPPSSLQFPPDDEEESPSPASPMLLVLVLVALSILGLPLYLIYKPPRWLIRYFKRRWPDVLWDIPTSKKLVALTIDDAPSAHTREILDILHANDATATFFVIGSHIPGRSAVLQDAIRAGNELANHAMYDEPSRSLSDPSLSAQLRAVQNSINGLYAAADCQRPKEGTKYFRPGSGFFSSRMRALVRDLGFQIVLGSVYPHDPQVPFWRLNARHILGMLRPGAVIICHDGREWTVPMLRRVLPEIRRRGYRIVTVTELLKTAG